MHEVIAILERTGLYGRIAPSLREYLVGVAGGAIPETPRSVHPAFAHVTTRIIGSNRLSTEAARVARRTYPVVNHGSVLSGDAAACGATLAAWLLFDRAREGWRGCVIWGGETTVHLDAPASAGDASASRSAGARSSRSPRRASSPRAATRRGASRSRRAPMAATA